MSHSHKSSLKTRSKVSSSVTSSTASHTLAIARAKAEGAKARVAFAEQEMQIRKEKAHLEATLEKLNVEKEAAAAIAEVKALESALYSCSEYDARSNVLGPEAEPQDTPQRTTDYVLQHAELEDCQQSMPKAESIPETHTPYIKQESKPTFNQHTVQLATKLPNRHWAAAHSKQGEPQGKHHSYGKSDDYNLPPSFSLNRTSPDNSHKDQGMLEILKIFTRRELLTSGLTRFNDRPETYRAWRSSFRNVIRGLDLSASEEANLLVKWLGTESAEHARRIRDTNVNYPDRGLNLIWERTDECYGSPEMIEESLFKRIENFPKIPNKGLQQLRELSDLVTELQVAKAEGDLPGLAFLDTARGVNPLVQKLPYNLQEMWVTRGSNFKQKHNVPFPPFSFFVDFVRQQAKIRNDPSFDLSQPDSTFPKSGKPVPARNFKNSSVAVRKIAVSPTENPNRECPLHKKPHPLSKCRGFREKTLQDRRTFLKENRICFRCCASTSHLAKDCNVSTNCTECDSTDHNTALHPGPAPWTLKPPDPTTEHGGEQRDAAPPVVTPHCTQVCGEGSFGKSCSKICLVSVYPKGHKQKAVKLYAILDDQSNRSLASSAFFDTFKIEGASSSYSLKTCTGVSEENGRRAVGFQIESIDGQTSLPLPTLIECNQFPTDKEEIPTPEAAFHHNHLKRIAHLIPKLDPHAEMALLLGRDIIRIHKVREQINGPHNSPYAQKLDLGWVIIGDVCLGNAHKPTSVNSLFTKTLWNGRPSLLQPCPHRLLIKEKFTSVLHTKLYTTDLLCDKDKDRLGHSVFQKTKEDNEIALSIEDRIFLKTMEQGFYKNEANSWVAPLPFRARRPCLPNNRDQALSRFSSLRRNFQRKPEMKEHFFSFMNKMFENDHAEVAPPLKDKEECWYLPIFGVYHPKKPGKIRVVFDSSSQHEGISLNDVLLKGPDLNNTLLGVLLRFRKEAIAIVADIEQMFHSFQVKEEHRNFLRFLWFRDNDPARDIIEYRMKVHVFGNSPSPAVAIYGLKLSAQEGEKDVRQFIERDFYVDDGLKSLPSPEAATNLLQRTQSTLACSNLRLHKIASNSKVVMGAFPSQDHASDLKDLDLTTDPFPVQRSLGLNWDLKSDTLTFQVDPEPKSYTRRGVLSTINSLYDPLGFQAPVTIQGKILLRELAADASDWDSPLPPEKETLWVSWRDSLKTLTNLHIHRPYAHTSPTEVQSRKLCVFCDASVEAIAAVAYLRTVDIKGEVHIGFVMGKTKLAPRPEITIPRLELCAAVLAVELTELITSEIDLELEDTEFYTDSKVVLGYIYNENRRFYVYVHNRVLRIRKSTQPTQWHYVTTDLNPADHATRAVPASRLKDTTWLTGPPFLYKSEPIIPEKDTYILLDPESDEEIRPQTSTLRTTVSYKSLGTQRFQRFSTWKSLRRAIACLIHIAKSFKAAGSGHCRGWHSCQRPSTVDELTQAADVIIRCVQQEAYTTTLRCLQNGESTSRGCPLKKLDPFIDSKGLLRVGGRISQAQLGDSESNPIVIPNHHIASLLVHHHHIQVKHQGRLFTEGALRTAGLWVIGAKRLVSKTIFKCITCRKLRGMFQTQKMANLPADRLSTEPPFTHVGLDVFGPWAVTTRQTRGGSANSKRWAVVFTCMSIRAVHIEVIESLDTSSFINALRRFISIRGPAKLIRSDRGTNFIGACKELSIPSTLDTQRVERYLSEQGCKWIFNPPHSSHMGGAWERMIGIARRILDSMFLQLGTSRLTHETLTTLMAEVAAIMNSRPLTSIPNDPEDPFLLTPSTLLTQKVGATTALPIDFNVKDLYKSQWRRVQALADIFWSKWKKQYLSNLQARDKWQDSKPNLEPGTVVLMKDSQSRRNEWPLGLISQVFPSEDGRVRKVQVKVIRQDGPKLFFRPVCELIVLLSPSEF